MTKTSSQPPAPFLSLPNELVGSICHLLPNSTIKNLRLTCRFFADKAQLRLRRVFISPSLDNLGALRGIADHDTFRQGIEEIIWDDATLNPSKAMKGGIVTVGTRTLKILTKKKNLCLSGSSDFAKPAFPISNNAWRAKIDPTLLQDRKSWIMLCLSGN
jgi:hypothetical protein